MDTVEAKTNSRSGFPALFITWLVIAILVILVVCIPIFWFMAIFTRHCSLSRVFKSNSTFCEPFKPSAPSPHTDPLQVTHDLVDDSPISMDAKMQELENKMEKVDEKQYNEKKDLHALLKKIPNNKARQAHEIDREFLDNQ